jgi:hypothetical protein
MLELFISLFLFLCYVLSASGFLPGTHTAQARHVPHYEPRISVLRIFDLDKWFY